MIASIDSNSLVMNVRLGESEDVSEDVSLNVILRRTVLSFEGCSKQCGEKSYLTMAVLSNLVKNNKILIDKD